MRLTTAKGTIIEFAEPALTLDEAHESIQGAVIEIFDPSFALEHWGES